MPFHVFTKASSATLDDNLADICTKSKPATRSDLLKFLFYCIGLVTACLIAFLIAASRMTVKPLQFQAPVPGTYGNRFSPDVALTAEVISVDPVSRTIAMNWYPALTKFDCASDSSTTPVVIDIFIKSALLDVNSPSWSPNLSDQAAYRLNSTEICLALAPTSASFRTVSKLTASKAFLKLQSITQKGTTFQNYPFDVYLAPFFFYTRSLVGGVITPLEISDSFGVAVNFKISLLPNPGYLTINGLEGGLQFYLRIERSLATKSFVVMVAISNWLTATAFLIICAATFVYQPHKIYAEMFVVPVGALFALSSVRANLPGAPVGFGATIDTYTILPVLIIMSFCSFTLLLVVLYRRICQEMKRRREESKTIEKEIAPAPQLAELNFLDIPQIRSRQPSSEKSRAENSSDIITVIE